MIDENGSMTAAAGPYAGLDRFEARKPRGGRSGRAAALLVKIEDYALSLGTCQRCKTVVEPLVSTQWFVKTKPLAEKAIEAVETGAHRVHPEQLDRRPTYEWMYNIRDWCISRQLWWGHRIPAWHCEECQRDHRGARSARRPARAAVAAIWCRIPTCSTPGSAPRCGRSPRSAGRTRPTICNVFYPTSLLITGFDILFFWVARMVMMGIEFMGDVPFRQVYIHGLVRDAERQKMSKTKGNVIDPLVVTEKYGTDAVRMALLQGAAPGTDIVLTEERMESSRAFANKIWNAARFLFMNMERSGVEPWVPGALAQFRPEPDSESLEPRLRTAGFSAA